MPALHVLSRSDTPSEKDSSATISSPVYIAGITLAGVIGLAVCAWLALRYYRQRVAAKRESQMGAAFLSVKGLVREDDWSENEKDAHLTRSATQSKGFSRNMLDSSIILPEKARSNPTATRDEIVESHRQSGALPKPFSPKPFSFALSGGSPRSSILDPSAADMGSQLRNSWMSFASGNQNRFSVMSGASSSFDVTATSGTTRKVRQVFDPVLPDELVLARLGEQLTLVQSFDDGWCVVGRENSSMVHTTKSLFKPAAPPPEGNVELGVVPAWCFLSPVKGLRAERPIRSTSLGITVNMDGPSFSSRNELVSWSNF
ncbi:hypothetical protein B0H34DRAFT_667147 [Crassisporium funariophilum]|nr:hypothetical protein B0H34DRAFT_667147 [Crassisporium funariophilum]